ncbi:hypothetical protein MUCCIDRAFT_115531 [Mucor lusitanicus CBS 277.49]|uniref:Uncharacterized protein n=1 Tax=Mucor lusitanicus CBS 277.49 TaxID=747725 RepID=A0A168HBZ1_MUCCL|nr:hypothetical protein MUCCIDRAFT_115531 [Mucor lusitanicus CBS 277.49]
MCCAAGKAILKPVNAYPETIFALSFTSMNVDLDRQYANEQHGAYAFPIYGNVYHLMSTTLTLSKNNIIQQPRFAQVYIFDSANELQNRMNVAGN